MTSLEQRVEQLERSAARWRRVSVVFAVLILTGLAMGLARPGGGGGAPAPAAASKTVSAERFVLVDAKGANRGSLALAGAQGDAGPMLVLAGANGRSRAGIGVTDSGTASLALFDANGGLRASLAVSKEGQAGLTLFDAKDKPRSTLTLKEDGTPSLGLLGSDGKVRLALGESDIALVSPEGKRRIGMNLNATAASVFVADKDANPRVMLTCVDQPEAVQLFLREKDGKPRVILGGKADGNWGLWLADKEGKLTFEAPSGNR